MIKASEITDKDSLQAWLETRQRVDSIAIAHRAAMRVFSIWGASLKERWHINFDASMMIAFRCALSTGASQNAGALGKHLLERSISEGFDLTRASWSAHENGSGWSQSDDNAFRAASHAVLSTAAATGETNVISLPENKFGTAELSSMVVQYAADAVYSVLSSEPEIARKSHDEIWRLAASDAIKVEVGLNPALNNLWEGRMPNWCATKEAKMLSNWDTDPKPRWAFWRRWWNGVVTGRPLDPKLQLALVEEIDDETWRDPDKVAARIVEIEEEFHKSADVDLYTATLFDFTFDKMAGVMRAVPLPQDWEHLDDPDRLSEFLRDASELREKLDLMCTALRAEGRAMQGAGIVATYAIAVLDELKRAENLGELRVGMLMEYGRILESAANSDETHKEFGLLSPALKANVESLRALVRDHFAYTLARSSVLKSIRLEDDADPVRVLSLFRDLVLDAKEARASKLVPISREDAAILSDILDSVDNKIRALAVSDDADNRSSLKRDMDFQMAKVGATYAVYRDRAKAVSKGAEGVSDDVLKWSKRGEGLWALARRLWDSLSG